LTTEISRVPVWMTAAAGIVAVTEVDELKLVGRFVELSWTVQPLTKLMPVSVMAKGGLPAVTVVGEMLERIGSGFCTLSGSAPDVPPPGAGVKTLIARLPAACRSTAGTEAMSEVALLNVVGMATPFTSAIELFTNPEPVRTTLRLDTPAVTLLGETLVSTGTGFPDVTCNGSEADVPPPGAGFTTSINSVPGTARAAAGIVAVTWVALTNVVVALLPLNWTVQVLTKPVPVTVRMRSGLPAGIEDGERRVITGSGFEPFVNCTDADTWPGSSGFNGGFRTAMFTVPPTARLAAVSGTVSWLTP